MCLGCMPNTGIYVNAYMHKNYLKTKVLCKKNRFLSKDLKRYYVAPLFNHTSTTHVRPGIQIDRFCNQLYQKILSHKDGDWKNECKILLQKNVLHNLCDGWKVFWNYLVNIQKNIWESNFVGKQVISGRTNKEKQTGSTGCIKLQNFEGTYFMDGHS